MKGKSMNILFNLVMPLLLGIAIVVIIYVVLTGRQLPLISTPGDGLIAVLVLGMIMCAPGIGKVSTTGHWFTPFGILGTLLGVAILLVFIGSVAGWRLPFVAGEKQSLLAMGVLIGVKFLIGTAAHLLHLV
jgi:hypothetical protein